MRTLIVLVTLISMNQSLFASGEDLAKTVELKKGGAVTAFTKEDGFKLSKRAINNLDVHFQNLEGNGPWRVPKSSLVRIKHSIGVYRRYDGWITMVLVSVTQRSKNSVLVKSVDLQTGDDIAVSGVPFLRMTEADLNSDTVDACAH
jgi:hypothetical protein